jgi:hypothetical protein
VVGAPDERVNRVNRSVSVQKAAFSGLLLSRLDSVFAA